jgi:LemA protein
MRRFPSWSPSASNSPSTTPEKVAAANEVTAQLQGVLAIGEAYPQLQSSAQFVQLQTRISALEGQIADRKEMFNETVTNFNTPCQQFPSALFAGMLGYAPLQLYRVAAGARTAPSVKLNLPAA